MRPHALFALLLALALLAGCVDPPAEDGLEDGTDGEDAYEDCQALAFPGQGGWNIVRIDCEANVSGEDAASVECPNPSEAELRAAANLTAGEAELRIQDGADETVARHRLSDTGGQPRNLTVPDDAEAGSWTLTGERLKGYEGKYSAELACPQE